jgi:hypothetical protein
MVPNISHDRKDESIEEKTLWFRSLSLSERMDIFCSFSEMILSINPNIQDKEIAQSPSRRIRILSKA